ncbi:hypothetical protein BZG02_13495 [Labilibaculum filiforme]|uniref:Uncharacterized protein n=1 Tax=Labilibaculum filiforme TaxID=1940526 RepID=A0A2N3HWB2_9BACT|nr:hypothetical protein [Labilibaculum filiforme]PKQ62318.1 hypothetical protein BZG02_13495 [Labilibaculum filiforme]
MTKLEQNYEVFLSLINNEDIEFVNKINDTMLQDNYASKIEHKKTLSVISYRNKNTKKVVVNITLKKGVLSVKIVGHHIANYEDFLEELPTSMIENIEYSADCKQLIDPSACWQACEMGSVFKLKGQKMAKCRYACFSFDVENENKTGINAFIDMERKCQL